METKEGRCICFPNIYQVALALPILSTALIWHLYTSTASCRSRSLIKRDLVTARFSPCFSSTRRTEFLRRRRSPLSSTTGLYRLWMPRRMTIPATSRGSRAS